MRISGQAKLDFHFFQNGFSLTSSNQMAKHVFNCQMFRSELGPDEWYMSNLFVAMGYATLVVLSQIFFLEFFFESGLEDGVSSNFLQEIVKER